jgi:hypothetical protein
MTFDNNSLDTGQTKNSETKHELGIHAIFEFYCTDCGRLASDNVVRCR